MDKTFLARIARHLIVYVYMRRSLFITLFGSITMLHGTDNILWNIPNISHSTQTRGILGIFGGILSVAQTIVMDMYGDMLFF